MAADMGRILSVYESAELAEVVKDVWNKYSHIRAYFGSEDELRHECIARWADSGYLDRYDGSVVYSTHMAKVTPLRRWLFVAVRNLALNRLQIGFGRFERVASDYNSRDGVGEEEDRDVGYILEDRRPDRGMESVDFEDLVAFVDDIPLVQDHVDIVHGVRHRCSMRSLVRMVCEEGRTVKEISRCFGLSVAQIRGYLESAYETMHRVSRTISFR